MTRIDPGDAAKFGLHSIELLQPTVEDALVLIDVQFLLSTARGLVAALGKPLAAIIITHPHPDHINRLNVMLEACGVVPVYANRPTIDIIRATQKAKGATWTQVYGSDYPQDDVLPTHVIGADDTLRLAAINFRVIDLGAGESADRVVEVINHQTFVLLQNIVSHGNEPMCRLGTGHPEN